MGQEVEHVRGDDLGRLLVDHDRRTSSGHGHSPQRVRPGPAGDERQIGVDQRITQHKAGLTSRRRRPHQAREAAHPRMIPAASEIHGDTRWITRVLGDKGHPKRDATSGTGDGGGEDLADRVIRMTTSSSSPADHREASQLDGPRVQRRASRHDIAGGADVGHRIVNPQSTMHMKYRHASR